MNDPIFLSYASGCALHQSGLALHGGAGTPDSGRLDSALHQAKNEYFYRGADHFEIAAAYAYNVSQGHVFTHGNKTAGALMALTFLEMNRVTTGNLPADALYHGISGLGNGVSKAELARIFRHHLSGKNAS